MREESIATSFPVGAIDDVYHTFNPDKPLAHGDKRYVELSDARGIENFGRTIALRIKRTKEPIFHHQLVTGHRGCGKSTELLQLQAELNALKYFTVFFDVEEILDLGDIKYQDLLVAISKTLVEKSNQENIKINKDLLRNLESWFADKVKISIRNRESDITVKGEASLGDKIPFLGKLLAALTSQIKSGSSQRTEIRQIIEKKLGEFTDALNLLINDARKKIREKGFHDIVIIVDGLEKMLLREEKDKKENGTSNHFSLFIHHAEQLKSPNCHIIYTVPIWLSFHAQVGDAYSETPYVLPMVKYQTREGRERLFEIVEKRANIGEVFENNQIVHDFIDMSGGSTRDLFRMVRLACDGVLEKIGPENSRRAIATLVRDYDRLIHEEDVDKLVQVAESRRIPTPTGYGGLLNRRLIHEYQNDERWADLHPAVSRQLHKNYPERFTADASL